ncbi:hypothetical protein CHGG_00768 [Chaetomium globosum CBS 148.51]|uniref:Protein HRI1 n=1 Tax=Chaetomium globosum (strain ATCC 6205 / CBS 148.51 / DSM 1962 / NBRC 6347 / NRRL 1970) TaxID=306901 RepID=Q2HG86_CHAGB|nr:uncharacterized protein CHGG_00768 [Chaetomium globosum CBS 148.51]EAQ92533.1 hypothetical protein CHGG_00768 [Chaetomium globosum CBS 148.51]
MTFWLDPSLVLLHLHLLTAAVISHNTSATITRTRLSIHSPVDSMTTASAPADNGEWVFRQLSTAGKRLFWRLNGPLEGAIEVSPSEYYEPGAVMEPYFGPDGSLHPVSQASLMEPPLSSHTVRIQRIDEWERSWDEQHSRCHDRPVHELYPRRLGPRPDDETFDPSIFVLECCGQKRPWSYDTYLQVAAQGEFLTVHEYVSAVHPWLMAMRDTLLDALGKMNGQPKWPPETKLGVVYLGPGPLTIDHEDKWASRHMKPPVPRPASDQPRPSEEELDRRAMARAMARSAAIIRAREEAARVAEMEKEK